MPFKSNDPFFGKVNLGSQAKTAKFLYLLLILFILVLGLFAKRPDVSS